MYADLMDKLQGIKERVAESNPMYYVTYEDYVDVELCLMRLPSDLTIPGSHYLVDQILLTMDCIMKSVQKSFQRALDFKDRHAYNLLLLFFVCPLVRCAGCPGKWWPFFISNKLPAPVTPICERFLVEGILLGHQWHIVYYYILVELGKLGSEIERGSFAGRMRYLLKENSKYLVGINTPTFISRMYLDGLNPSIELDRKLLPETLWGGESRRNLTWQILQLTYDSKNIESLLILFHCSSKDMAVIRCLTAENKYVLYFLNTEQATAKRVDSQSNVLTVDFVPSDMPNGWVIDDQKRTAFSSETRFTMSFNSLQDAAIVHFHINAAKQPLRKISFAVLDIDSPTNSNEPSDQPSPVATQKCILSQEKSVVGDSQWTPNELYRRNLNESQEWFHKTHSTPCCQTTMATPESQNLIVFQCKRQRRQLLSSQQLGPSQCSHMRKQSTLIDSCCHALRADSSSGGSFSTANTTYVRCTSSKAKSLATRLQMEHNFNFQLDVLRNMYHNDMDIIFSSVDRQ